MGYISGKIDPPVSIYDVQRALGVGSTDLGTLCSCDRINKWARYKPQRWASPALLTHGSMWGQSNTRKGQLFGLNIPFCTNDIMNGLVYSIWNDVYGTDAQNAWKYLQPRGSSNSEYYRLTDFARIPTDTTDPFYNTVYCKGYNHQAKIPFEAFFAQSGIAERYDASGDFTYYEINAQVTNTLTFTFGNSVGDDLHLQDLINLNGSYASGIAWRPVLQVFKGEGSGQNAWYNRSSILASNGDIEVGGAAITSDTGAQCSVSLNLNAAPFYVGGSYVNYYFHVCVGVGCCKQDFSSWNDNNNSLFIMPFTQEQIESGIYPFYYIIKVVSYQANSITFDGSGNGIYWHSASTAQWSSLVTGYPTFEIGVNADQQIRLVMTFNNVSSSNLDFIALNGTPTSGYTALIVQALESISGEYGENTLYLQPTDSSWSNGHTTIRSSESTKTLYATINTSEIPAGGYATYHLKAISGGSDYDDIGSFSIHKRTTV